VTLIAYRRAEAYRPHSLKQSFSDSPCTRHSLKISRRRKSIAAQLWLELSSGVAPDELHHHDVMHFALEALRQELADGHRRDVIGGVKRHLQEINTHRPVDARG